MENIVNLLIRESTVSTIDNTIKLPLRMESETEIIMNSLTVGDILSPGKLDFVAVSVELRRGDDRVPYGITSVLREVKKRLLHLSLLDLQLIFITNGEPLRSTIELKSFWKWNLYRRLFHYIELLCLVVRLFGFEHAHVHDTSWDTTPSDDNLASIWRCRESLASEDELVDSDVFENLVF